MNTVWWYIRNKVILFDVKDNLQIEDLKELNKKILTMLSEVDSEIHIIYRSANVALPKDIYRITEALTFLQHQNRGWVVTIGSNILMTFAGRIVNDISNIKLKAVPNLEEADKFFSRITRNHMASIAS